MISFTLILEKWLLKIRSRELYIPNGPQIRRTFLNPKSHYGAHKARSTVLNPSQINPALILPLSVLKLHYIYRPTLRLGNSRDLLPSGFPAKSCTRFTPLHAWQMACPSLPSLFDHSKQHRWTVHIMKFFTTSCHFPPLKPKYLPQHPVLTQL